MVFRSENFDESIFLLIIQYTCGYCETSLQLTPQYFRIYPVRYMYVPSSKVL